MRRNISTYSTSSARTGMSSGVVEMRTTAISKPEHQADTAADQRHRQRAAHRLRDEQQIASGEELRSVLR